MTLRRAAGKKTPPADRPKRPARRRRRALGIALAAICLPVLAFFIWFRVYYRDFCALARPAFRLPGLSEDFVPQGIESCGEGEFLLSGYIATTGSARIYAVDAAGSARAIRVCDEGGTTLTSHAGGICTNGPFTYLAGSGGNCYVLSSADLFDPTSTEANILGTLKTDNAASFCYLTEDALLVGEYEFGRFKTPPSHHVTTPSGDRNTAVVLSYPLDGDQPFGVCAAPDRAYSVPPRVQGMCLTDDGRIVLSASSFQDSSQLYLYDQAGVTGGKTGFFRTGGQAIPLHYMDSGVCTRLIHLPPYSEEAVYADGKLYVLFESASSRFHFGKLIGAQFLYRMKLPPWEGER